jgi:hypothetical protein
MHKADDIGLIPTTCQHALASPSTPVQRDPREDQVIFESLGQFAI